jgi:hypothetical protein
MGERMIKNYNELDLRTDTKERRAELAGKHGCIEPLLSEHQLDAILISRNENVAWATAGLVDMRVGVQRKLAQAVCGDQGRQEVFLRASTLALVRQRRRRAGVGYAGAMVAFL